MNYFLNPYGSYHFIAGLFLPLVLWSLTWKGLTLWVTARRGATWWFVLFVVLNTLGIGEIIYLYVTKGFDEIKSTKSK